MGFVKSRLMDRALLFICGLASLALLVGVLGLMESNGISGDWQALVIFTVFWFGVFAYITTQRVTHGPKIVTRWMLPTMYCIAVGLHLLVLGVVISRFHPNWKAPGWLLIFIVELPLITFLLDAAHNRATRSHPS